MRWTRRLGAIAAGGALVAGFAGGAAALEQGQLRAGAARRNITPPADLPVPMSGYGPRTSTGIHDSLFVRALVVDDGTSQAAIVTGDLSSIGDTFWESVCSRVERETGIPRLQILLAATHTHSGPALGELTDDHAGAGQAAYARAVEEAFVAAVQQARGALQPARFGAGTGTADVNINRRARLANGGWWLGTNPDGPSDKTVAVVKFETMAGDLIALFANYPVHATVMGPRNTLISGDLAGATSRVAEQYYQDRAVVLWTSGAGGDQRPLYNGEAGFGGPIGPVDVMGQILAAEVTRVAQTIPLSPRVRIRGLQTVVTCPGKKRPDLKERFRADGKYEFLDADPVALRLSLLKINNVAFAGVSGEVLVRIGLRLKEESPFRHTIMVTHCNGSSGYFPDDAAYDHISYEIVTTRAKRGCAEDAIVGGLLDLMDQ